MFRFQLRDLFWLALVCACATLWYTQHRRSAEIIEASAAAHPWLMLLSPSAPPPDESPYVTALAKFAAVSNEELVAGLEQPFDSAGHYRFEPCLTEMVRRGMHDELTEYYASIYPPSGDTWRSRDAEVLTALRRAQGLADPLKIHVALGQVSPSDPAEPTWHLQAQIENVDAQNASVTFQRGGDYRSGRQERWQVVLKDQAGQTVEQANFANFIGGGISSSGPLGPGEKSDTHVLDIRAYVAPPPTGDYTLQVFYHNRECIAGEQDLSGLIASQSEPIRVHVENPPNIRAQLERWQPLLAMLVAALTLGGVVLVGRFRRSAAETPPRRRVLRDVLWCGLVLGVAIAWLIDQRYQSQRLEELKYHPEQHWTIRQLDA
jgi:hypothetical protein